MDATRRKQWTGGLSSLAGQTVIFIPIDHYLGHWISALTILAINIGLAATFKSTNPYLNGARWATFMALSLVSVARHTYWYETMLASFVRLSDFNRPLSWNTVLCEGTTEAAIITVSTSVLIMCFYYLTPKWPEWTDRWEMLRRAPFSASLGFQAIIAVTVVHPTPATMTSVLFFAGIISPIIRRQVRLNHVVFLMLTPLFALGVPELAAFWGLVVGLIFFVFIAVERSMTDLVASFAFFNGVVFTALTFSTLKTEVLESGAPAFTVGLASFSVLTLFLFASYYLLFRTHTAVDQIRTAVRGAIPVTVRHHSWWNIRDLWVDREVAHRVGKLFKWKDQDKTIGYFIFGPKYWAPRSETFDSVPFPKLNLTPAILVLTIYAFFQAVDTVLFWTTGAKAVTIAGLIFGFIVILGVPFALMGKQLRKGSGYGVGSLLTSGFSLAVLLTYMGFILFAGLTSTTTLNNAAQNLEQRTGQVAAPEDAVQVTDQDCECIEQEEPLGLPGKDGL